MYILYTLLNYQYLSLETINNMLTELAKLLSGVYLILFEETYFHFCKLRINNIILLVDVIKT